MDDLKLKTKIETEHIYKSKIKYRIEIERNSSFSLAFCLTTLCFHILSAFSLRVEQVPFSMAIGNVELMHECILKHLRMGTAIMK